MKGSNQPTLTDCIYFSTTDNTILIKEKKTWEESLTFCRKQYNDLVSITSSAEQKWMQYKSKNATSDYLWLGLRYTCALDVWFWVSNEVVHYSNWYKDGKMNICDMAGALERESQQKWRSFLHTEKFNFMCFKSV